MKSQKTKRKKSRVKIADELWRDCIKARADYRCERCGSTKNLHSHHVVPRTDYSLRYDLDNGVCLCHRCHFYWAHKDSLDFTNWFENKYPIIYDYLQNGRGGIERNDYDLVINRLEAWLKTH